MRGKSEMTQDWDELEALRESLREHMAEIHRLRAALAECAMQRLTDVQQEMENTHTSVDNEYTPVKPVAWRWPTHNGYAYSETHSAGEGGQPLYTAPPQRTPLTEDELVEAYCCVNDKEWAIGGMTDARIFARAIERAHGIGGEG